MQAENMSPDVATLPGRAGVGLLTLQLRTALQEASEAEAAEAAIDHAAARAELWARLTPLLEEHRAALRTSLDQTRAEGDASIAAAKRAASVMVAQARAATATSAAPTSPADARTAEPVLDSIIPAAVEAVEVVEVVDAVAAVAATPISLPAVSAEQRDTERRAFDNIWTMPPVDNDTSAPVVLPPLPPAQTVPAQTVASQTTIVVDAEAFARVFATVIAEALAARGPATAIGAPVWPVGAQQYMGIQQVQMQPVAAPQKQSFWTHAKHLDVLLLGLGTAIALVVLAAWIV